MATGTVQAGGLDQRLALDVQGVDSLRRAARRSPEEGLRQVSRQFEAIFMNMVLKSMRDAVPASGMFDSQGQKLYQSMLDQQLAQTMAGRGLGLADAMYAQLRRGLPAAATDAAAAAGPAAAGAVREPRPAATVTATAPAADASAAPQARAIRQPRAAAAALPPLPAPQAPAGTDGAPGLLPALRAQAEDFLGRVAQAARSASEATGVPQALIVAQAALESGWGRRELPGVDGARSFNLFGIKADRSWRGAVTEAVTTEVVDGALQRVKARFRAYGSYEEAFADYARFLAGNPRYARVLSAPDAQQAAHALQRAGYATDPDYAAKLVRVMKSFLKSE